jgi:hypothetical protein
MQWELLSVCNAKDLCSNSCFVFVAQLLFNRRRSARSRSR